MSHHRVLKYECTVHYASTGSSHTGLYPFNQTQADTVGAVLEPDGISIEAAKRLVEKWNRGGNREDIRYVYSIPFGGNQCSSK